MSGADERPGPRGPNADCELCAADRFTHWYHEDEHCWVADCEACSVPMVVWNGHGTEPGDEVVEHLMSELERAADARFGPGEWKIDRTRLTRLHRDFTRKPEAPR